MPSKDAMDGEEHKGPPDQGLEDLIENLSISDDNYIGLKPDVDTNANKLKRLIGQPKSNQLTKRGNEDIVDGLFPQGQGYQGQITPGGSHNGSHFESNNIQGSFINHVRPSQIHQQQFNNHKQMFINIPHQPPPYNHPHHIHASQLHTVVPSGSNGYWGGPQHSTAVGNGLYIGNFQTGISAGYDAPNTTRCEGFNPPELNDDEALELALKLSEDQAAINLPTSDLETDGAPDSPAFTYTTLALEDALPSIPEEKLGKCMMTGKPSEMGPPITLAESPEELCDRGRKRPIPSQSGDRQNKSPKSVHHQLQTVHPSSAQPSQAFFPQSQTVNSVIGLTQVTTSTTENSCPPKSFGMPHMSSSITNQPHPDEINISPISSPGQEMQFVNEYETPLPICHPSPPSEIQFENDLPDEYVNLVTNHYTQPTSSSGGPVANGDNTVGMDTNYPLQVHHFPASSVASPEVHQIQFVNGISPQPSPNPQSDPSDLPNILPEEFTGECDDLKDTKGGNSTRSKSESLPQTKLEVVDKQNKNTILHYMVDESQQMFAEFLTKHPHIVKQLMDTKNSLLQTPVFIAVMTRNHFAAEKLRDMGSDLSGQSRQEKREIMQAPLHKAVELLDLKMVDILIHSRQRHSIVDQKRIHDRKTPLMMVLGSFGTSTSDEDCLRLVMLLVERGGATIDILDERSDKTILMMAIETRNLTLVEYILKYVGEGNTRDLINRANRQGNTSVHIAAGLAHKDLDPNDHVELLKMLVYFGGNTDAINSDNKTPKDWKKSLFDVMRCSKPYTPD